MPAIDPKSKFVEMSADVPIEEFNRFKNRFPQYGATKWWINAMLVAFNDVLDQQPDLQQTIDEAIDKALEMNRLISRAIGGAG